MGNSSTKEHRPHPHHSHSNPEGSRRLRSHSTSGQPSQPQPSTALAENFYSSRHGGSSRPDFTFLGLGANMDREIASLEARRESKQEREARRAERERVAREKERERSMRDESVDGGYLVTQGVYTGVEDFSKATVRQLMTERRLAPFFRGLNDLSDSWTDSQLMAVVRGQPMPAEDSVPPGSSANVNHSTISDTRSGGQNLNSLTVAMSSRSPSFNSDLSANLAPMNPQAAGPSSSPTLAPMTISPSTPFRPRSKTLASLTTLSKSSQQPELVPQEIRLPSNSSIDGRPIEVFLYRNAIECPICFLYYPPYLNRTRCCDQSICSECFVQIKRPDPHVPEHTDPAVAGGAAAETREEAAENLVSEPAACPFCVQPAFGVTYDPPPFRSGLAYANQLASHPLSTASPAMSSSSSLASNSGPSSGNLAPGPVPTRRRAESLSVASASVITTDMIRPDWAQKLASARAHAARRSAAATALHTAAYLMSAGSGGEGRGFAGFSRRSRFGRGAGADGSSSSSRPSHGHDGAGGEAADNSSLTGDNGGPFGLDGRPPGRRSRLEDLEEMMMMEAIRLSLASEEERKRKEEKESKKEGKKKEKESKRAERASSRNPSNGVDPSAVAGSSGGPSNAATTATDIHDPNHKGKGAELETPSPFSPGPGSLPSTMPSSAFADGPSDATADQLPPSHSNDERCRLAPQPSTGLDMFQRVEREPIGPSHLRREMSNSSSPATTSSIDSRPGSVRNGFHGSGPTFDAPSSNASASALNVSGSRSDGGTSAMASTPPAGGAGSEPMFNFRSLAAMIGDEEKPQGAAGSVDKAEGLADEHGGPVK